MIDARGLRKVFKGRKSEVVAVDSVDLQVHRGEIFGFLGPNGAGKTTTLRMLATLMEPTAGEAKVAGHDLRRESAQVRKRIGWVGQADGVDPEISGREELQFQARLYGASAEKAKQRAVEVLEVLELTEAADRQTKTYSGGQRRRLDIGLGLIHEPPLLFMDEPTTGLDPQSRARMWEEVRRLRERGVTVFLTTHYLEEADALCDRLAIIDHGRIVAVGTPSELKQQISGDVVTIGLPDEQLEAGKVLLESQPFVRESNTDGGLLHLYVEHGERDMPRLLRLIDGAGLSLKTISLARPSLDDVFLHQTGRSLRETAA
jgi:ABC-2 type transport system ATP-binding protein